MHGQSEHSIAPRVAATLLQLSAVGAAAALLLRDGQLSPREWAVLACSGIYAGRVLFGMFFILNRRFAWSEAGIVGGLFLGVHLGMAYATGGSPDSLGLWAVGGLVLYGVGSYLNTASEYGRMVWKRDPAHKGKLYREGLFRHSMHINYFGDTLLFSGFALVTGSGWAFIVPAVMTAGFVFQHIPNLDAYLAERYGDAFEAYARTTKKFVPYLY